MKQLYFIDKTGKKHNSRHLSELEEQAIKRAYLNWQGESLKAIAKRYGVSVREVESIGGKK